MPSACRPSQPSAVEADSRRTIPASTIKLLGIEEHLRLLDGSAASVFHRWERHAFFATMDDLTHFVRSLAAIVTKSSQKSGPPMGCISGFQPNQQTELSKNMKPSLSKVRRNLCIRGLRFPYRPQLHGSGCYW